MKRALAACLALCLLCPVCAGAQQAGRSYRLAFISINPAAAGLLSQHTLPELARHGFLEGRNLTTDSVVLKAATAETQVRELLARNPDAILAVAGLSVEAARAATSSIPIVAIGTGGAAGNTPDNLARPRDNVTGTVILGPELDGKRLEFLNELAPGPGPIATLLNVSNPYVDARYAALIAAAAASGIDLRHVKTAGEGAYEVAFEAIRAQAPRALLVGSDPQHLRDARLISRLALEARIPSICHWREMAEAGCLASYGPSLGALYRRSGEQLGRLMKGARVQDIPMEAPAVFEFVINLKIARQLGVTPPQAVIARADEVIE